MSKRPPVYTFQRPRKKNPPSPIISQADSYTLVDDNENNADQTFRYSRYTFFVVLIIFILLILGIIYIYLKGLPVKIRP